MPCAVAAQRRKWEKECRLVSGGGTENHEETFLSAEDVNERFSSSKVYIMMRIILMKKKRRFAYGYTNFYVELE